VWTILKNCCFEILKNHHGNIICHIYKISSSTFKVATTKFSRKFTMFQKSFHMFKALEKSMWTGGFLYQKSFSLIKCSPNCFNFFVNFNIFHKKGSMCSKHSKNKNTYTFLDFNTRMSFYIINEFVIMVQSKVIDLTIMQGLMQKKLNFYHVICHIWPQVWYLVFKTMRKTKYKPIENYHVKNVVLEKDFNFGTIGSFFHVFTLLWTCKFQYSWPTKLPWVGLQVGINDGVHILKLWKKCSKIK
jgi:hypothetical protein